MAADRIDIDLSTPADARSLHELIARCLEFPACYGHNFDALDDVLNDPAQQMPSMLVFSGCRRFAEKMPRESALLIECFDGCERTTSGLLRIVYAD